MKFRNTELNFEGLVLRLVKDFGYYDASNDEELADFRSYLGMKPPAPGETSPPGVREAALNKSQNQPRPRTFIELKQRLAERPYIIYDGFADSGALVDKTARMTLGIQRGKQNLPFFQLEYSSFMSDARVGGRALSSGYKMIPLTEGVRTLTLLDQVMKAKLRVEVRKRD